jgi:hypothetical protein
VSAREKLYAGLMRGGPHSPDRSEKASMLIDAYAHELAEKQRRFARETVGGGAVGAVCLRAIDGAADLIDPEVSCGGYCSCICHAVDPSPCDDCSGG